MKMRPALVWAAVLPAMIVPFVAALFYFVISTDVVFARGMYAGVKVFLVVWPLFCSVVLFRDKPPRLRMRFQTWADALAPGLLTGVGIAVVILVVMLSPLGRMVEASASSIRDRVDHLGVTDHYWLFAIFLSLIHSFIEEYYWRWFVYGELRGLTGKVPAALLSSAAFASHHVLITGKLMNWPLGILCGAGIAVGGLIWAHLFQRQRTLLAPWLSHVLADFTVMAVGYRILTM